jgi:hypothetical protein
MSTGVNIEEGKIAAFSTFPSLFSFDAWMRRRGEFTKSLTPFGIHQSLPGLLLAKARFKQIFTFGIHHTLLLT